MDRQGVNCTEVDPCLVTPENLVGVVAHAYAAVESEGRKTLVASLQAKAGPFVPIAASMGAGSLLAAQAGAR